MHAQKLFPPKWRSRWLWHHLMMSLSFCLHIWRGYIRKCPWALGFFFWFFIFGLFLGWFNHEATDPLSQLRSASRGVGLLPNRKVFFICSSVSAQGYLEHPELACFSCLWASWVACHPASIWPSTWKGKDHNPSELSSACGINLQPLWAHQIHLASPEKVTYVCKYWHSLGR